MEENKNNNKYAKIEYFANDFCFNFVFVLY